MTISSKLTITRTGTPVAFTCTELGAYALPVGALSVVDSSVVGWDAVANLAAGVTGRFVESDADLRLRHAESVRVVGAATVPAIRARVLQEVDSVTSVSVYENRTHLTVGSLPPHSFETVVAGGVDQAVAEKIYEVKPAGIETYGNTTRQVLDNNGDLQLVKFSRPVVKYAWVRVNVTSLYAEEALPEAVVTEIKNAVFAQGSTLGIGEDIITQRFYGAVYAATSGIGSITVEAAVTVTPLGTPVYSTANIAISRSEVAAFDLARIVVTGVV